MLYYGELEGEWGTRLVGLGLRIATALHGWRLGRFRRRRLGVFGVLGIGVGLGGRRLWESLEHFGALGIVGAFVPLLG